MNNLSWLIYLADLAGSVNAAAAIIAVISCLAFIILSVEYYVKLEDVKGREKGIINLLKYSLTVFAVCCMLSVVAPSSDTVYAIAASEMGEELAQSDTANKALEALNSWLDNQINDDYDDEE